MNPPDQVWASIKTLAQRYAASSKAPSDGEIERELEEIISLHLGRKVDARLMTFYRRELDDLIAHYRAKKTNEKGPE